MVVAQVRDLTARPTPKTKPGPSVDTLALKKEGSPLCGIRLMWRPPLRRQREQTRNLRLTTELAVH